MPKAYDVLDAENAYNGITTTLKTCYNWYKLY